MTLLGLTLAVGIVIDDAIVVLENIFRHMEEEGAPPFQAAIDGTNGSDAGRRRDVRLAGRHLPAGRVHDRLHAALHLPVRLHDGVRGHGVAARQPDADADAERARRPRRTAGRTATATAFFGRIDALYRRSLEWSLDHRGGDRRRQPASSSRRRSCSAGWSAARSCRTRTWASSSSSSTRRKARRCQGMEKAVLELTPKLLADRRASRT